MEYRNQNNNVLNKYVLLSMMKLPEAASTILNINFKFIWTTAKVTKVCSSQTT